MADGQVVFEVTADGRHVKADIKEITKAIESEGKKWDQSASQATSGIENSFAKMAGNIAGKLAAAGITTALLNFGKAAVEAASDLAEVQNVVDTVFGDGARTIESWSKKAGEQFGLTEIQAKKFTSTLGAMMKSSGLAGNEIINMSTDLAGLAADMASFYNLDFETAFEKIRSGISGETMPLKQLGINMSVANLEAFALAQGLEKTFSQMTQGEQTMLRYQYLMQATSDAQGDFEKTSDGFANAQRRIESSITSIQSSVGKILLPAIESATSGIANFLAQIAADMMPDRTIMDEFNDAEIDSESKLAQLEETYQKANDIIKILAEMEKETVTLQGGETITLTSLFGDIAEIEKSGGDINAYIEGLGLDVNYVIGKYNEWKEATRQLTDLVPSLSSVINEETGAIDGGTEALQRNLDEWKKTEEKKIYWAEYYAKAEAVARAKGEQAGLNITAKARANAAERQAKKLAELYGTTFSDGRIWDRFTGEAKVKYESGGFNFSEVENDFENYNRLIEESEKAQREAEESANDLADAEALLADEYQATVDLVGEELPKATQNAGDAEEKYLNRSKDDWNKVTAATTEAVKALNDYYQTARDATAQSVNSIIKNFDHVGAAGDDLRKKQAEIGEELAKAETKNAKLLEKAGGFDAISKMSKDAWDKLKPDVQEAYNEIAKLRNEQHELNESLNEYKPEGMKKNLQSQLDYMNEYLDNLEKAQAMGLSDELLASLSDGSKESAEYLKGLVEGGPEAAKAVDELYKKVEEKKGSFTDALTQQKLTVDETYQAILDKATSTIEALNMGGDAEEAMAGTVDGIANGIAREVPAVKEAVDALLAELNRLSGFGMGFEFDTDGNIIFNLDGSNEKGLDYVPFDGYLSELHEGEGILTAEENRIWQRFKNGDMSGRNVDYDALGGLMRDNVKAGGNVYLDGRAVGQVVSSIQGNQFRTMQRSGFQG